MAVKLPIQHGSGPVQSWQDSYQILPDSCQILPDSYQECQESGGQCKDLPDGQIQWRTPASTRFMLKRLLVRDLRRVRDPGVRRYQGAVSQCRWQMPRAFAAPSVDVGAVPFEQPSLPALCARGEKNTPQYRTGHRVQPVARIQQTLDPTPTASY